MLVDLLLVGNGMLCADDCIRLVRLEACRHDDCLALVPRTEGIRQHETIAVSTPGNHRQSLRTTPWESSPRWELLVVLTRPRRLSCCTAPEARAGRRTPRGSRRAHRRAGSTPLRSGGRGGWDRRRGESSSRDACGTPPRCRPLQPRGTQHAVIIMSCHCW